jgi:hypothetical protein
MMLEDPEIFEGLLGQTLRLALGTGGRVIIAEQLAAQIEALVVTAQEGGLSDKVIADALQDAADALHEGLT